MRGMRFDPAPFEEAELVIPAIRYRTEEYDFSGVYFLFRGGELTYIGQSDSVLARIASHRRDKQRKFDTFSVLRCGRDFLLPLEAACIRKFAPTENRQFRPHDVSSISSIVDGPSQTEPLAWASPSAPVVEPNGSRERTHIRVVEAADRCGLSKSFLDKARSYGGGPPYTKLGRSVFYAVADLDAWIASHRVEHPALVPA